MTKISIVSLPVLSMPCSVQGGSHTLFRTRTFQICMGK